MTRRIGNVIIIEPEKPRQCDLCGMIAQLRPYGPNGERICWECGLMDTEARHRQMFARLDLGEVPDSFTYDDGSET